VVGAAHDAGVTVEVGDDGPGLDDEAAAHVLERGWTTKATGGGGAGRGVGLTLVGQVARRYDGSVDIGRSSLGGARLTVTMRTRARAETRG
jgi:signal transduction histidine kinase